MKPSNVWHGRSTRPSLPAGTARKASRSLPRGRRSRLIISLAKRNRAFPTGNALLYISLSCVDFSGCVLRGAPCFCFAQREQIVPSHIIIQRSLQNVSTTPQSVKCPPEQVPKLLHVHFRASAPFLPEGPGYTLQPSTEQPLPAGLRTRPHPSLPEKPSCG